MSTNRTMRQALERLADWAQALNPSVVYSGDHPIAAARAELAAVPEITLVQMPPLDDDLIAILGRPNFTCIHLAQALRLCGVEIKTKAEHEQATVIHFLLTRYMLHGADWAKHADADLRAMLDKVEAANKAAMSTNAEHGKP